MNSPGYSKIWFRIIFIIYTCEHVSQSAAKIVGTILKESKMERNIRAEATKSIALYEVNVHFFMQRMYATNIVQYKVEILKKLKTIKTLRLACCDFL